MHESHLARGNATLGVSPYCTCPVDQYRERYQINRVTDDSQLFCGFLRDIFSLTWFSGAYYDQCFAWISFVKCTLANVAYSRLSVSEDDRKSQPARNTLAMLKEKVTPESLLCCLHLYKVNIQLFHSLEFQPLNCPLSWQKTFFLNAILKLAARPWCHLVQLKIGGKEKNLQLT